MPVIVHEARLPQGLQLLDVGADLHLDAGHTIGVPSIGQVPSAAVTVAGHTLGSAGLPGHGGNAHRGRGGDRFLDVEQQSGVGHIINGHIVNAGDLGPVDDIVHIGLVPVIVGVLSTLTHTDTGTNDKVRPLGLGDDQSFDIRFRNGQGVLVVVRSAPLQLAGVGKSPVPQPPLGQHIELVAICPESIVGGDLAGQGQRRRCAGPRHRGKFGAAGHATSRIFPAVKRRVPGQPPAAAIRSNIPGHRLIPAASHRPPAVVDIGAVPPLFHGRSQGKAVYRGRLAGEVELSLPFHSKDVHRSVLQGQSIGSDVPGHGILSCPVRHRFVCIGQQRGGLAPVGQIVHRRTGVVAGNGRIVKAHSISLILCRNGQHFCEPFQALIFGNAFPGGKRPPALKNRAGIGSIQEPPECGINKLSACATGRDTGENVILPACLHHKLLQSVIGCRISEEFPICHNIASCQFSGSTSFSKNANRPSISGPSA